MKTLRQLMRATPRTRIDLSHYVKVVGVKKSRSHEGMPVVMVKTRSTVDARGNPVRNGNSYLSAMEIASKPRGAVICSCSCDDFKYRLEYYLAKAGNAHIEYSNGEAPTIRAHEGGIWLCKHLYAMGSYLIAKGLL